MYTFWPAWLDTGETQAASCVVSGDSYGRYPWAVKSAVFV